MTDEVCHAYTRGFLQFLESRCGWEPQGAPVAVGGDLRPSTGRILEAVMRGVTDAGAVPVPCGRVPSPAVAGYGLERRMPSIMVTGSHIPDDRNGIKFNKPDGELLKDDEAGMLEQEVGVAEGRFDGNGAWRDGPLSERPGDSTAELEYVDRYLKAFPVGFLKGCRIGVYQHSAVGRDVLVEVLSGLGASVKALGRSDRFIPVDTEAIRDEDVVLAKDWARDGEWDALVSTDGDSDRPLISDGEGHWLRGDVAGVLTARFLGADSVSTPVSSNTAVEKCGWFPDIRRTRIGSPYVVASLLSAAALGHRVVVGFEANGGFLLNSRVTIPGGGVLPALPTRDALVVILGVLGLARQMGVTVAEAVRSLPARFTASDRLAAFPVEASRALLERFNSGDNVGDGAALEAVLGGVVTGKVGSLDRTDGIRSEWTGGEVVHLRPSGNAPEFRVYTEAGSEERAVGLCRDVLAVLESFRNG
jgi:phosphomannomutase